MKNDDDFFDPIVGFRFATPLSDSGKWRVQGRGDIGGFGVSMDLTWQAILDFGYRPSDSWAIWLGYRALAQDFDDSGKDDRFAMDVDLPGPAGRHQLDRSEAARAGTANRHGKEPSTMCASNSPSNQEPSRRSSRRRLSFAAAPGVAGAADRKPEAPPVSSDLPKAKQTTLGLYVTAAQAYEMWKAAPDNVKIIDVRTPEEFAFVGHPAMAWNVPIAFVTYQRKDGKFTYAPKMNAEFVALVREIAQPTDTLLVTCRSGGRSAMGVNALAKAGFTNVYNIVDGVEGDTVDDPDSVFHGKRMKNGWKNSAPWVYDIDPEKVILEEGTGTSNQTQ